MVIAITGGTACGGGEHRIVETDKGNYIVLNSEIQATIPDSFEESKRSVIIVLRHQYLTRRAAGRTHNQAMSDLVGFVVRV